MPSDHQEVEQSEMHPEEVESMGRGDEPEVEVNK